MIEYAECYKPEPFGPIIDVKLFRGSNRWPSLKDLKFTNSMHASSTLTGREGSLSISISFSSSMMLKSENVACYVVFAWTNIWPSTQSAVKIGVNIGLSIKRSCSDIRK